MVLRQTLALGLATWMSWSCLAGTALADSGSLLLPPPERPAPLLGSPFPETLDLLSRTPEPWLSATSGALSTGAWQAPASLAPVTNEVQPGTAEIAGRWTPFRLAQYTDRPLEPGQEHAYRSAGGAAALSLLFPGAGQIYNGQWPKAFYIWLGLGVTAGVTLLAQQAYERNRPLYRGFFQGYAVGILLGAAIYVYNVVDAYTTAENINHRLNEERRIRNLLGRLQLPLYVLLEPGGAGLTYRATF